MTALLIPSEKVPPAPFSSLQAKKRTGGEGASESRGGSERASRRADNARKHPFEHFRSGARRSEGWHATRACFFTPAVISLAETSATSAASAAVISPAQISATWAASAAALAAGTWVALAAGHFGGGGHFH
jgi:hypothetical protein